MTTMQLREWGGPGPGGGPAAEVGALSGERERLRALRASVGESLAELEGEDHARYLREARQHGGQ